MKLSAVTVADVLVGKNWTIVRPDGTGLTPLHQEIKESQQFTDKDHGLFSAILKCGDGSEHPALIVKVFPQGGLHTDTFVHTRVGWLNIFDDGFARALGKYPNDIYPFEVFVGRPWIGDKELAGEGLNSFEKHTLTFDAAVQRLRAQAAP